MNDVAILIPTLPPESARVELPDSMNPEEQGKVIGELAKISTEIARVQTRDEERSKFLDQRFRAIDARLAKIEDDAENTGRHELASLEKLIDKRDTEITRWKFWLLGIVGAVVTSTIVGLVVHYLSKG